MIIIRLRGIFDNSLFFNNILYEINKNNVIIFNKKFFFYKYPAFKLFLSLKFL